MHANTLLMRQGAAQDVNHCSAHKEISFISHLSSESHLDTELVVCGCTVLLFACDDSEDVAVFKVC